MEAVDIEQIESFEAGTLFAAAEGIIPAPESCHAIAATIREAKRCKETGEAMSISPCPERQKRMVFASYDQFLAGNLINNSISGETIAENLRGLER